MTSWGNERKDLRRLHAPSQGRKTRVYGAMLPVGSRIAPTIQTLVASGFKALVTVTAAATAESYVLVVGTDTFTVVASATDTKKKIANKLIDLIAASLSYRAINLRLLAGNYQFDLISQATFTLAKTGTTTSTNLTVGAVSGAGTATAKGSTIILLALPLQGKIAKGQYIQFLDPNGIEYLAKVNTTAVDGDTNLAVTPLEELIPAGSTAIYPPEFTDREDASIDQSFKYETTATFNTGGFEDGVNTGASAKIKLDGIFYDRCPSYRTFSEGIKDGREIYILIEYGNFEEGYTRPTISGICGFDSKNFPLAVGGLIKASFSGMVLTPPVETFTVLDD